MSHDKAPKGYPRHKEAISPQNRVGQAWKPGKVEMEGEDIFGNKKKFMVERGNFKCKTCDAVVRIDIRGYAHCENCGDIFNDGFVEIPKISNRGRKKLNEKFKYDMIYKGE